MLERLANEAGFDGDAAAAFLASEEGVDAVTNAEGNARELGVNSVPFFIFNGRIGVSGAQPAEVLLDAMKQAESAA